MNFLHLGLISWTVLTPLLAVGVIIFIPKTKANLIKQVALLSVSISLVLAFLCFVRYDRTLNGYQFVDKIEWIKSLGISYHVGIDGIGAVLVLLGAICSFAGVYVSSMSIEKSVKEYFVFYLMLVSACLGVFSSLDLFFLYFFYEMAVLPVYPLIGKWGSGNKEYATMKLTLYLTAGALLALVGLLWLYSASGLGTFDIPVLETYFAQSPLPDSLQNILFPLIMVGFGVIVTLWPFHTWSPMGYAAAPTAVSMIHAGVLKKLGALIIIRVAINLLPTGAHTWMPLVAWIAAINILYCGLIAWRQRDLKFILGYSSCSHMGYILLGLSSLNPIALTGTVFYMFAHGVMAALGFALVGFCYEQTHTRMIDELGGLAKKMPFIATCFTMMALASAGLPGLAPFVGEVIILIGSWGASRIPTLLAILGLVVTATYTLRMVRQTFQGPLPEKWQHLTDAKTIFQRIPYAGLLAILIIVGFLPMILLPTIEQGVKPLFQRQLPSPPVAVVDLSRQEFQKS